MTPPESAAGTGAAPAAPAERSITDNLASLWSACRGFLHDVAELAALEAHDAKLNLAGMIGCSLAAAVMAVTAWLLVVFSIVSYAVGNGVSWPVAMAVAAIANLTFAALLVYGVVQLSRHLWFTATRRQLVGFDHAESGKAANE